MLPSNVRTRAISRSARSETWAGDSPRGPPSRNRFQSGRDYQRIAFVAADRVALPARGKVLGMFPTQANMTYGVVKQVNERDLVGLLQDQHPEMKPIT